MERPAGIAGSLGPRLAGRLTAELVLRSPQYMNTVKEYEIDLRGDLPCSPCLAVLPGLASRLTSKAYAGHKIGQIENLGTTEVRGGCEPHLQAERSRR